MTYGTLSVDFAGTRDEAREFVRTHPNLPLHVGHGRNVGNEGLPMLTTRYTSAKMREQQYEMFNAIGWSRGCVIDRPYKTGRR